MELRSETGHQVITIDKGSISRWELPRRHRGRIRQFTIDYEDTAYLATPTELAEQEATIKQQAVSSSNTTIASIEDFPLYSYSDTSTDLSERTGPISLVWDTFREADNIQYEMQNLSVSAGRCWCSAIPSKERYVLLNNGNTPAQHAGFAKGTGALAEQWHVRLWDLPDGRVVGQPHFEVWDHCWVSNCNFRFDETRDKVVDAYTSYVGDYDVSSNWVENGSGYEDDNSADGWAKVITRS